MTAEASEYDELYLLLVQLCEQQTRLADEAVLCVMEAFNGLAELHTPDALPPPDRADPAHQLSRVIELLDALVDRSQDLVGTLQLMRVRRLVSTAQDAQR